MPLVSLTQFGQAEFRGEDGGLIAIGESNAINADLSRCGEFILVTYRDGRIIIYDRENIVKTFLVDKYAVDARFNGAHVNVTIYDGKSILYALYAVDGSILSVC